MYKAHAVIAAHIKSNTCVSVDPLDCHAGIRCSILARSAYILSIQTAYGEYAIHILLALIINRSADLVTAFYLLAEEV